MPRRSCSGRTKWRSQLDGRPVWSCPSGILMSRYNLFICRHGLEQVMSRYNLFVCRHGPDSGSLEVEIGETEHCRKIISDPAQLLSSHAEVTEHTIAQADYLLSSIQSNCNYRN